MLICRGRMLVCRRRALLRSAYAVLSFLINLFHLVFGFLNCLIVSVRLISDLIHLRLNGRGCVADVLLSCASTSDQEGQGERHSRKHWLHKSHLGSSISN